MVAITPASTYIALRYIQAGMVVTILYHSKPLTSALFSAVILGRTYSRKQSVAIFLLMVGISWYGRSSVSAAAAAAAAAATATAIPTVERNY